MHSAQRAVEEIVSAVDFTSFGKQLRQQRERKQLSIQQVAQSTKISPSLVEALEDGQYERFPERVFLVNYVRTYAQTVGLSEVETLRNFESIALNRVEDVVPVNELEKKRTREASSIGLLLASVLTAFLVAIWFFWFSMQMQKYSFR